MTDIIFHCEKCKINVVPNSIGINRNGIDIICPKCGTGFVMRYA